jgi:hypothetical protein
LTNFVPGANKLSLLASQLLLAGALSGANSLQFPGIDGEDVYTFSAASQSYSDAFTHFVGYGWFDPKGAVNTNGPTIAIAQSFFVRHPGPDTNWVVNVFQPAPPPSSSPKAANGLATPVINHLATRGGAVTLQISSPGGGAYNVQFSADGVTWRAVATNQTGATWTGPYLGDTQGYYRLANP